MRGGIMMVCFLFALPFFAAIGHDVYLAYGHQEDIMAIEEPPKLTDLTWMLVNYVPSAYDWIQQSTSQSMRDNIIVPLLRMKTIVASALPLALLGLYLLVARLMGLAPFGDRKIFSFGGGGKKGYTFKGLQKESKRVKYKRKK